MRDEDAVEERHAVVGLDESRLRFGVGAVDRRQAFSEIRNLRFDQEERSLIGRRRRQGQLERGLDPLS